jgi:hypothetical protein
MMSVIYAECHTQALYAQCRYAECHYAECRYAKCRYAECRNTKLIAIGCQDNKHYETQYNNKNTTLSITTLNNQSCRGAHHYSCTQMPETTCCVFLPYSDIIDNALKSNVFLLRLKTNFVILSVYENIN